MDAGVLLRLAALLLAAVVSAFGPARGASAAVDDVREITSDAVNAKLEEISKTTLLDEPTKNALLGLYRQTLANLAKVAENETRAGEFAALVKTAPAQIEEARKESVRLQAEAAKGGEPIPSSWTLKDMEVQLLKAKADHTAAEGSISALDRQQTEQGARSAVIKQRLSAVAKGMSELDALPVEPALPADPPWVAEAREWLRQSERKILSSEAEMLNQELLCMPALTELTEARREAAAARLEASRALMQLLETAANRKRQEDAAQSIVQAKEAVRQTENSLPFMQLEAQKNAMLSRDLQEVTAALETLDADKSVADSELKKVEESFRLMRRKIELAGVSRSLGFLLHEQRRSQSDVRSLRRKIEACEEGIAKSGLLRMQHEEEMGRLGDVEGYINSLSAGVSPEAMLGLEPELRALLESRASLLEKLIHFDDAHFGKLSELEIAYRQQLNTVESFNSFLDERLLWVRSTPVIGLKDIARLPAEVAAFVSPGHWLASLREAFGRPEALPALVATLVGVAALRLNRRRLLASLGQTVALAGNSDTYRFAVPFQALGLTMLHALSWPLPPFVLGGLMLLVPGASLFTQAVGGSLIIFAYRCYLLNALRALFLPGGLAEGFFRWPKPTIALLRRETGWLIVTLLPAVFVGRVAIYGSAHAGENEAFARLVLMAGLGAIAVFFYRVLHPATGVWHRVIQRHSTKLLARFYPVFFVLVLLAPTVMAGLIFVGYVFSVGILMIGLFNSLWVAFGVVICHQVIEQGLLRTGGRFPTETGAGLATAYRPCPGGKEEQRTWPREAGAHMDHDGGRKLLDIAASFAFLGGMWLVWEDVFPALRVLNEFTLWGYTSVVNGQNVTVPVTLGNLGLAALIVFATWMAARRLPQVMHIFLLRHFTMSPGGAYTMTTLSGYAISVVGAITAVGILGFKWSQIQWLVAALGVGIGFGLQEIVANFISGLIILFERPIRVGDIVTVGSTDGTVSRIRIRATTIRDFDGKELLVPNKEFIAGQLLNWSLSDPVTRIIVPVGVAYGSDVQRAMALMMDAAGESRLVLGHPAPVAFFEGFGENSLLLKLRCFIGSINDRMPAISDLHVSIERKFREEGISIAFPQRDVHLDFAGPVEVRMAPEAKAATCGGDPEGGK